MPTGALDDLQIDYYTFQKNYQVQVLASLGPTAFKSITAIASGVTTLWTPSSSKKFRILSYRIDVAPNVASLTPMIDVDLTDGGVNIGIGTVFTAPTVGVLSSGLFTTGHCDLKSGYLSTAADAVLGIRLSAAITGGKVRVTVTGREE